MNEIQTELKRRKTNADRLQEFFIERPHQWIAARDLEFAGRQAWRTRISELRKRLEAADLGTIVNRVRRFQDGSVIASEYMYRPKPLGRDAAEKIAQKCLF
jgi:hypothetical protein